METGIELTQLNFASRIFPLISPEGVAPRSVPHVNHLLMN